MTPLRAAYGVTVAGRYLLGAVAGRAAPLWCRVRGHGARYGPVPVNEEPRYLCLRCLEWV